MKKRMLMPYAASRVVAWPVAKALEKYYDVDVVYIWGKEEPPPFEIELEKPNLIDMDTIVIENYDVAFGFDPSTLNFLVECKKRGIFSGCTVLDVPNHVFKPDRNHNESISTRWKLWKTLYEEMDFVVSWRQYTVNFFGEVPHLTLFAPTDPPALPPIPEKEPIFVYSGIVRPDKGVHNIIEALSLVPSMKRMKLVVIGAGYDLSSYAHYLKVPYEQIQCSEVEKYQYYRKAMGVVSYPDNPWIPPLSPIEAISIGLTPIVTDSPEGRHLYGDCAEFVPPNSNMALTQHLDRRAHKPKEADPSECFNFWKGYRSHAVYAESVFDFLDQVSRGIVTLTVNRKG